ncbi:hypothetical protein ACU5JM_01785 (plasmid) [Rhodococcus erythropolis]|uniref:hypothetical protein n=1 Tax=Rhodococcus erythropolis TaxID=1833 RepID=UPI00406BC2B9
MRSTQTESTATPPTAINPIRLVLILGLLATLSPTTVGIYLGVLPTLAAAFEAP